MNKDVNTVRKGEGLKSRRGSHMRRSHGSQSSCTRIDLNGFTSELMDDLPPLMEGPRASEGRDAQQSDAGTIRANARTVNQMHFEAAPDHREQSED